MLSVIVCSVNPDRLRSLKANIAATIGAGAEYEVIGIDNREDSSPLARVYNAGAEKARYPNLLFIHEDAGFESAGWWKAVAARLSEPDCGVVGFAGSRMMPSAPGGWNVNPEWSVWHYRECGVLRSMNHDTGAAFTEVAVLDGYAMFVRRDVWATNRFDESALTGFHCYDIDFTLAVGASRRNYVCNSVTTFHDSRGHFGREWHLATRRLYEEKWARILPRVVPGLLIGDGEMERWAEQVWYRFIKTSLRTGVSAGWAMPRFGKFRNTWRHLRHMAKICMMSASASRRSEIKDEKRDKKR